MSDPIVGKPEVRTSLKPWLHHRTTMYRISLLTPNGKEHALATIGEFVGSFIFLMFGSLIMQQSRTIGCPPGQQCDPANGGLNANTAGSREYLYMEVIMGALGFGFGMMTSIYIFNDVSGVHLTPPITLAQTVIGNSPAIRVFFFIPAQIVSGIAAAYAVDALTPGEAAFAPQLAPGVSIAQGFFIELFGSSIINLSVLFITQHTKGVSPAVVIIAPCVGMSAFVGHLFSMYYTGGSLNPARAIGACLADRQHFPRGFWIYIVAPMASSLLSTMMFGAILKFVETSDFNKRRKKELQRRKTRTMA